MKHLSEITFILLILIGCNNPSSLIEDNNDEEYYTSYTNSQGVKLEFNITKSNYNLNEYVYGEFIAINVSNDTIRDTIPGGPDHYFIIKDSDLNLINFPIYRTTAFHMLEFCPGDTIRKLFTWDESENADHITGHEGLKVIAGRYLIIYSHIGINTSKLGKWINITEDGNSFSSNLYWYFSEQDSLKLDFIIRNRIQKDHNFELVPVNPVRIELFDDKNLLIRSYSPNIAINTISLPGQSTSRILKHTISREDSLLKNLIGSYKCKILINCKTIQFLDSTQVDLY